jgi:hypothetical protein
MTFPPGKLCIKFVEVEKVSYNYAQLSKHIAIKIYEEMEV